MLRELKDVVKPDFRRLSAVLAARTGWQVVAVPGLVPDEVFFDHLANRRFPTIASAAKPTSNPALSSPRMPSSRGEPAAIMRTAGER